MSSVHGTTPANALSLSDQVRSARAIEAKGFRRYWLRASLADDERVSPLMPAAIVASTTQKLAVGTFIGTPSHTSSVRLVRDALLLELLFPGRIDVAFSLAQPARELSEVEQYLRLLRHPPAAEADPVNDNICRSETEPRTWLVATEPHSAGFAGKTGIGIVIEQEASTGLLTDELIRTYVASFVPSGSMTHPSWALRAGGGVRDVVARVGHPTVVQTSEDEVGEIIVSADVPLSILENNIPSMAGSVLAAILC